MPTLSVARVDVVEDDKFSSGAFLYFQVVLSEPSDEEISFTYLTSPGTAVREDFAGTSNTKIRTATAIIPAGDLFVDIAMRVLGDTTDEVDESVWLEIFNPKGAELLDSDTRIRALGVLQDEDGTGSDLALFVSSPVLVERDSGTTVAVFDVHLSRAADSGLTFDFQTVDGSAKAGSDYVAQSGSLTFLQGETFKTVEIAVNGDTEIEPSEFFSLVVTPTADIKNGALGSTGIATIFDADAADSALPTISVERAGVTELGNFGSGPNMYFRVTLSEPSDEEVTVAFTIRAGSAVNGDFLTSTGIRNGVVTFAAGDTTALVRMQVQGDQTDEVDESVWIELYDPKGAALAGGEARISALGVVSDENGTGSDLALFVSSPTLREGDGGGKVAVFEIHLSHAYDEDLSFGFQTSDGSAKAGSDYVAKTGTVTFLAGQTIAVVEVQVDGDGALESSESFSLVVTATSVIKNTSAYHVGSATIVNDDSIHELLEGNGNDNEFFGQDGNDRIYGFGGDDELDGGRGKDEIRGGVGDDEIIGGAGRDKLYGDEGKDVFVFRSVAESRAKAAGRDTIFDFDPGQDLLDLKSIDANTGRGGNQAFRFIGTDAFSKDAGTLRYERDGGDIVVYGDVNGNGKADFSILLADLSSLRSADFVL